MSYGARLVAAVLLPVISSTPAVAQTTERVSVDSAGVQANDSSEYASISADGNFVVFVSNATNLVAGDANGVPDVFVHDRQGGTTERVSVSSTGTEGDAGSGYYGQFAISADNRFVAFTSYASNLVAGDTNGVSDVFVRDRALGTTERVSISTSGAEGNLASQGASISADGRFVGFSSDASNLVVGDTNGALDGFVRDRANSMTERVSVSSAGAEGNNGSGVTSISADGRFVAIETSATNFDPTDTDWCTDVYVRDRRNGTTERVSIPTFGVQVNVPCSPATSMISADGRFVAFDNCSATLVAGDTNGCLDVFVRDRIANTTERVSVSTAGVQANDNAYITAISADGRFVAFISVASNLVAGDTNAAADVFVRDRSTSTTERVSLANGSAQGNSHSGWPSISADGRVLAFSSHASNLVAGDTNATTDIFVRDLAPQVYYCSAGTTSSGCSASIAATTPPSASFAHACSIAVANVEGLKSGVLFYGIDNTGWTPGPWGTGSSSYLCVKQPTQRTPIQNSGGTFGACDGSFVLDWNAYQSTHPLALGNPWSMGAKVYVQAWFRDPPAAKTSNLSNALELTYVP